MTRCWWDVSSSLVLPVLLWARELCQSRPCSSTRRGRGRSSSVSPPSPSSPPARRRSSNRSRWGRPLTLLSLSHALTTPLCVLSLSMSRSQPRISIQYFRLLLTLHKPALWLINAPQWAWSACWCRGYKNTFTLISLILSFTHTLYIFIVCISTSLVVSLSPSLTLTHLISLKNILVQELKWIDQRDQTNSKLEKYIGFNNKPLSGCLGLSRNLPSPFPPDKPVLSEPCPQPMIYRLSCLVSTLFPSFFFSLFDLTFLGWSLSSAQHFQSRCDFCLLLNVIFESNKPTLLSIIIIRWAYLYQNVLIIRLSLW